MARSPIPRLLAETLLELCALPFHVAWFVLRRRRIRREIRDILESQPARARAAAADAGGEAAGVAR